MEKKLFGTLSDGTEVTAYTIKNSKGMKAVVMDYGAILLELHVPDGKGQVRDVVLGYDSLSDYLDNNCFFGATIAPNANRIANAKFTIDGNTYEVEANENGNNLHSHFTMGAHKRMWDVSEEADNSIKLTLKMVDGEIGFPGNIVLSVIYAVTEDNGLTLTYEGTSDKKTIINPTNHTYFNLSGHDAGSITECSLKLKASRYTEVGEGSIPTGINPSVAGTVMDFTSPRRIGDDIDADFHQLAITGGYDHNFVIDGYEEGKVQEIAVLSDPASGLNMSVYTDLPGVQFYAGNSIKPHKGKGGVEYGKRCGLCLETDYFPDTINQTSFPSAVYGPDRVYRSFTEYRFF